MSFYVQFEKAAWLSVVTALDSQSGSLSFMSSSWPTLTSFFSFFKSLGVIVINKQFFASYCQLGFCPLTYFCIIYLELFEWSAWK